MAGLGLGFALAVFVANLPACADRPPPDTAASRTYTTTSGTQKRPEPASEHAIDDDYKVMNQPKADAGASTHSLRR
jgi:hypothetical protein